MNSSIELIIAAEGKPVLKLAGYLSQEAAEQVLSVLMNIKCNDVNILTTEESEGIINHD